MPATPILETDLADEAATARLARALAPRAKRGDVIALFGGLGAGKTAFARAFVNALPGPEEEVPSPTFTLAQIYERDGVEVHHFDLYRLEDPEEAFELGIEDAFADAVSLIEWPERLGDYLPARTLTVELTPGPSETARHVRITGLGDWPDRLAGMTADA